MDSITIKLKAADKSYSQKFALTSLDNVLLSHDDKTLQRMVEEATASFHDVPQDITIKATFKW